MNKTRSNTPSREKVIQAHELLRQTGNKSEVARQMGLANASIHNLFDVGLRLYGIPLPDRTSTPTAKGRRELDIQDGVGLIGSDAHYWPGPPSTAHRAFCLFAERLKPRFVVMNGDALDLTRVSRHPPPGWTRMPETHEELEAASERMGEIVKASGKALRYWPWGNHDQRWEIYLATHAPEVHSVPGMRLVDHFPDWEPCYSLFVNNRHGGLVIKHRYRAGIHAPWNNTTMAGRSIVTGHLHSQMVRPFTDLNGTRWGVDAGCLADPWSDCFQYLEDNPRQWVSGFVVVTFKDGALLPPELVTVTEPGKVWFRGETIDI